MEFFSTPNLSTVERLRLSDRLCGGDVDEAPKGIAERFRVRDRPDLKLASVGGIGRCFRRNGLAGVVEIDPRYYRPAEVGVLLSDPSQARALLGLNRRVGFNDLVHFMVDAEIDDLSSRRKGDRKPVAAPSA